MVEMTKEEAVAFIDAAVEREFRRIRRSYQWAEAQAEASKTVIDTLREVRAMLTEDEVESEMVDGPN